jgi:hypothetical protein
MIKMPFKGRILNEIIKYVSFKLAENHSFQKLSLRAHEKIEGMRRTASDEFLNPDTIQRSSVRRLLIKLIESAKEFLKKP